MVFSIRRLAIALVAASVGVVVVPQRATASECDITKPSNTSCSFNGGLFYTDEQHATGTGLIDSFLRIQQNGWEQGYNTGARPVQDEIQVKIDPNFTRNLLLSEVGTTTIGGTTYYEFFLDVNEPAATNGLKNYITLDQLEIYASTLPNLDYYNYNGVDQETNGSGANTAGDGVIDTNLQPSATSNSTIDGSLCIQNTQPSKLGTCKSGTTATQVYDLDTATTDNWVTLDYLVKGNGSGSSDMVFYVPTSYFPAGTIYVYLFSQFGDYRDKTWLYESQAGFEEWFVKKDVGGGGNPLNPVPEPGSLLLLGTGLGIAARRWRKSRQAA